MAWGRRMVEARQLRAARARGFETALGLADEPPPVRAVRSTAELRCGRCDGAARIETLDLRTARGLARCEACDHAWSVRYDR